MINNKLYAPEHGGREQVPVMRSDPAQEAPPLLGTGFVQLLSLVCIPVLQVTEQLDH